MPRWPDIDGQVVARLDGFTAEPADRPPSDAEERVFRATFTVPALAAGERAALAFDGIATVFTVHCNGAEILRGSSMFLAHEVDVTAVLVAGDNVLTITCHPIDLDAVPRRPRQRWRTKVVADGRLRFVRTAVLGRAPGFAPGPPIVGPWRPVWLVRRRGPVRVESLALRPRLEDDAGVLDVQVRGAGAGAGRVLLGDRHAADLREGAATVRVPGVARWWPHTHGTPALHDVALELADGTMVRAGRVGFRSLSPGPGHDAAAGALDLVVNGIAIFARGAVWTPVPDDALRATLEAVRDAGMNMVRVVGTAVYESPAFHDLCDALGIMVWQDFMYANLDYSIEDPAFRASVLEEARQALATVAGRPSLTVLCGNSEVEQQAAMAAGVGAGVARGELFGSVLPGLAAAAGVDVPYVPSAPCGGALPFHPGSGVANYYGVGGYRRPLSDARTAGVRFAAECLAFANVPDADADADADAWVPRDVGAEWDFADVRDHYLGDRYGVDAAALRAADPARYLALSRQVSGDVMAAVFGEWRRAGSPCAGALVLWLRDLRPGAGWGLLDHRGDPKVALAALARVLAPRAVWLVDEGLGGLDAHVANDAPSPLRGRLEVALLAGGAHPIAEGAAALEVGAHAAATRNVEAVLGRFADASGAYRFGPLAHDAVVATVHDDAGALVGQAVHFPGGPPLVPRDDLGLTAVAAPAGDGAYAVTLRAAALAWGVRVIAPGFRPTEDALTVVPGTPRTVMLRPRAAGADLEGATVRALNGTGDEPIAAAG